MNSKKNPRGFAPAGTPTASLAGSREAPLRSADSLAAARSFHDNECESTAHGQARRASSLLAAYPRLVPRIARDNLEPRQKVTDSLGSAAAPQVPETFRSFMKFGCGGF